jgi:hypothetical protein
VCFPQLVRVIATVRVRVRVGVRVRVKVMVMVMVMVKVIPNLPQPMAMAMAMVWVGHVVLVLVRMIIQVPLGVAARLEPTSITFLVTVMTAIRSLSICPTEKPRPSGRNDQLPLASVVKIRQLTGSDKMNTETLLTTFVVIVDPLLYRLSM